LNCSSIIQEGVPEVERRLAANEPGDLISANPPSIEDLLKKGKVIAGTAVPFQVAGLGLSVRAGVPKPDISTVEAYKATLLNVRSIGYSHGCSGAMTQASQGALSGIRVLDLTRVLAGPLCAMMLGDMGADIIKVEPPGSGDDTRRWGPPFAAGESAYFLCANRNKRSMTLNMAVPAGQKVLAGLIEKADVVIDNFKVGTLAKWGFTDAWFEANAPRAVRCSITGYGTSGPKAALPGYDFVLQAESGLMSICGEPQGTPTKYGVAIVDVCTGMLACNAILAAINARHGTGRGQQSERSRVGCWSGILGGLSGRQIRLRM
jgi:CoA-transferase family III